MSQMTMDQAITGEILARNLDLILHALADAQAWREDLGDEESGEAYAQLAAELEEFQ